MRIYLAARYSRRVELCGYADELRALGHAVEARWLAGGHQISETGEPIGDDGERLVEGDSGSDSPAARALRSKFAQEDLEDVANASCLISFTEPPRSKANRGGRHVEFGFAVGMTWLSQPAIRLIVVGQRENLFHWLPWVEFYPAWANCLAVLRLAAEGKR